MANILIIDDDIMIGNTLKRVFCDLGHTVDHAPNLTKGRKVVGENEYDIVFLDVGLPDGSGVSAISEIRDTPSRPEVIIITGYPDAQSAEIAMKNNAWDYIRKPASIEALTLALNRSLEYREEKRVSGEGMVLKRIQREGIIGDSTVIREALDLVARAATMRSNILITGETGTGKELFARAIHANSTRADHNFVTVDCTALPENLIENLLFGHKKGAFTGAEKAEEGLIKHADGGTLFLDEVGELSLATQKSFLRVIQERQFRPLGGKREIESDFRLVAATNRNIDEMVEAGTFREDLLFRLSAVTIHLPPLRDRISDIKELCIHYTNLLCESQGDDLKGFSSDFFEYISRYHWPGNVRELHGALEWALTQARFEPTLYPKHLPERIRIQVAKTGLADAESSTGASPENGAPRVPPTPAVPTDGAIPKWSDYRKTVIDDAERKYMNALMAKAGGNVKDAAELSGLSAPRLYELLRKHDIDT
jgi:two-component system NtrC family response regulator